MIADTCAQQNTTGPTGTTFQIAPTDAASVSGTNTNAVLSPSGSFGVRVSPAVHPGVSITVSWTTFHDGCFSAHGGITLNVVAGLTRSQARKIARQVRQKAKEFLEQLRRFLDAERKRREADSQKEREKWEKIRETYIKAFENIKWAKDLQKKLDPKTWPKTAKDAGVGLRTKQLKAMPDFVKDINKIANYETTLVNATDTYYATPDGKANVDFITLAYFNGKSYESMTPAEKADVGRLVQSQTGALNSLLQDARDAGKSATRVTFGG